MTALDTNVLVRFLVRDDERQAAVVYRYLKRAEKSGEILYISLLVVLEIVWVLESAYRKSRQEILTALESLLHSQLFRFDRGDVIAQVISDARRGNTDVADLMVAHATKNAGCKSGITFDKKASKHSFFTLLK